METIRDQIGMHQLQHTFYYSDLKSWWDRHHKLGGSVYECFLPWDFFPDFKQPLTELFKEYAELPFKDIDIFQNANIYDNDMSNRDVMEDATKTWMLYRHILDGVGIKYNPQIIHEPWYDRYRVHPGSGRLAAMWLAELNNVHCIYTHFDEPGFEPPPYSHRIYDVEGMVDAMFGKTSSKMRADISTYYAFPKDEVNAKYTNDRDSEWDYSRVETTTRWEFVRYSEGNAFTEAKYQWRRDAMDLWYRLNSHDCELVARLDL